MPYNLNGSENKPMAERVATYQVLENLVSRYAINYSFFKKKAAMALLTLT